MEVGLHHAEITQKMCDAWMSTIILTICERGKMIGAHNINRMGFCLLANIPDLWFRTQTSRASELLVNLNSSNGDHGKSTVARLFDLTKANGINAAIIYLNSKRLKKRPFFRMIPTLQYLATLGIQISKAPESNKVPLALVEELTAVLQGMLRSNKSATVYTDGSTPVRSTLPNSGCSIYVTDSKDNPIWSGGMIVRSDGNNFIAELAAAAIVIKSCPASLPLTMKIDSKAAIGALTKGRVSERKRVRAAGRAWLNFCRDEFLLKRHHINIQHVSSHRGLNSAEQIGNDQADQIANLYRNLGEKRGPVLYFTQSEEPLILAHNGKSIQGDIRSYIKSIEKKKMTDIWKLKAPRQAEFFGYYPRQIQQQAKQVWKWSVEKGEGQAWLYFIFGICQWLPTQHRLNKHLADPKASSLSFSLSSSSSASSSSPPSSSSSSPSSSSFSSPSSWCLLCLSNQAENMAHLWTCPATAKEQSILQSQVNEILVCLPYGGLKLEPRQYRLQQEWVREGQHISQNSFPRISKGRLSAMANDFWHMNRHKEFIKQKAFAKALSCAISRHPDTTSELLPNLLSILVEEFSLTTEGFSNPFQHSPLLDKWCSEADQDREFGAIGSFFTTDLSGRNTLALPQTISQASRCIDRTRALIESKIATRVVLILPELVEHKFLVIARFDMSSIFVKQQPILGSSFSIALALNKESMHLDPINWPSVAGKLREMDPCVEIPTLTDSLFREREIPTHQPRCNPKNEISQQLQRDLTGLYTLHRPLASQVDKKQLRHANLPSLVISALANINRHNFSLSALGILPNEFRKLLLKEGCDPEPVIDSLRKTFFWGSYRIWKRRKRLVKLYWESKAKTQRKKRRLKGNNESACKNEFHFLMKIADLSKKRLTKCPCSHTQSSKSVLPDIRDHLKSSLETSLRKPSPRRPLRNTLTLIPLLDHKHLPLSHSEISRTCTQSDIIRGEHDRGKKRKMVQLKLSNFIVKKQRKGS